MNASPSSDDDRRFIQQLLGCHGGLAFVRRVQPWYNVAEDHVEVGIMIPSQPRMSKMSRFSVSLEVANYGDLEAVRRCNLTADKVRRVTLLGLVDPGATRLVLPKKIAEQLGLAVTDHVKVKYADGRTAKRPVVEGAYVTLQGRHSIFMATVEPKRDTALIGALVLEDLDFLVDCKNQKLVPRDPKMILSECE